MKPDHIEANGGYRYCLYLLPEYHRLDWEFESEEKEQETLRSIEITNHNPAIN